MSTPSRATICRRAINGRNFCCPAGLDYPERLNCISELLDRWVENGEGDRPCLISPAETLTYAQLAERVNRIANVLTRDFGLVPGNRVLLRGPNNPMMVASILAVIKAGGVVVATMPLLRAKELSYAAGKAKIALALCDVRLADEMEKTKPLAPGLKQIVYWGDTSQGSLESLMTRPGYENFTACDTASDDVCLIGFTSGTTGEPKGTMHFHRDLLATCDTYGRHVLRATAGRPLHRLAAARLHVRARRPRAVSVARRRVHDPAGESAAGRIAAGDRKMARHHLLHRADRLSRHARRARTAMTFRR